jgi:hypothetical protein
MFVLGRVETFRNYVHGDVDGDGYECFNDRVNLLPSIHYQ